MSCQCNALCHHCREWLLLLGKRCFCSSYLPFERQHPHQYSFLWVRPLEIRQSRKLYSPAQVPQRVKINTFMNNNLLQYGAAAPVIKCYQQPLFFTVVGYFYRENSNFFCAQHKHVQILQISQDYIFYFLQSFATKIFTNLEMSYQAVVKDFVLVTYIDEIFVYYTNCPLEIKGGIFMSSYTTRFVGSFHSICMRELILLVCNSQKRYICFF